MQTVIKQNNGSNSLIVFIVAGSMLAGAYYCFHTLNDQLAAMGLLMLAAAIAIVGRNAEMDAPQILIDETGIFDERLGVGKIFWDDVIDVHIEAVSGVRFLCLRVKDHNSYLNKLDYARRRQIEQSRELGFRRFNIDMRGLPISLLDLKSQIEKRIV